MLCAVNWFTIFTPTTAEQQKDNSLAIYDSLHVSAYSDYLEEGGYQMKELFFAQQLPVSQSLLILLVSISHATTQHSRQDSSGRVISPSQRPLRDITQHSQQTDIHACCGIRTNNPSRRAAVDLCFRPRGQWNRPKKRVKGNPVTGPGGSIG